VRAACARHLRDLETGAERGLTWDTAAVERVIGFFRDVLRLNGGEHEGKPFVVEPWQAFVLGSLFGWKGADGYRRFRVAFIETAKGSGKSPLAAGVGLYGLMADNEPRAEVYAAAAKKDQAAILFRDAVAMVRQSPALSSRLTMSGGAGREYNIAYLATGSFFRPISSDDGQSGPRPHIALLDEIHEHKSSNVVEMVRAGTKGRRQALIFMITNSGFDRTSVCYDYHEYGAKVSAGDLDDDTFFSYIAAVDEDDDPIQDPSCWAKANPSLGVTIPVKYLEEQVTQAKGMPAKESIVRRLNFCQWVDAESPWIDGERWRACADDFDLRKLAGRPCYGGLDLSGARDLTALALLFPPLEKGERWRAFVEFWTPGDTLHERARTDRVPYDAWVRDGHLHAPPGRAVDYSFVARRLGELAALYELRGVAFDPYRIKYFEQDLAAEGVEVELKPHGQGYGRSSESGLWMPWSVDTLEQHILEATIGVKTNPALNWNAASAVIEADAKGNRIFTKRKSTGRIDGIVALAMAVGYAAAGEEEGGSVYEERGVLML
jgi:phage terminase large subunit-like protein